MTDPKEIILEYFSPAMGVILANIMFFAPVKDLRKAVRNSSIGDLNPTPWAFMLGNCFGWVVYGVLLQNYWIFFGNSQGFLISIYLNLGASKLLYQKHHYDEMKNSVVNFLVEEDKRISKRFSSINSKSMKLLMNEDDMDQEEAIQSREDDKKDSIVHDKDEIDEVAISSKTHTEWMKIFLDVTSQRKPAPTPHETLVMTISIIWFCIIAVICLITGITPRNRELIVASLVNFNLVFFYGAPLSTIMTVSKTRDSSSIHVPTMVTNTLNGFFWTCYGIAVFDLFIAIPNGIGALFGFAQMILCMIFPRRSEATDQINIDIESNEGDPLRSK